MYIENQIKFEKLNQFILKKLIYFLSMQSNNIFDTDKDAD